MVTGFTLVDHPDSVIALVEPGFLTKGQLAIRSEVSDGIAIMVDYNQCLTTEEAVERVRVLDDVGLTWVEEPTLAQDYCGHAMISREVKTPIQCGENWWGTLDLRHALAAQASDYIMPDVMKKWRSHRLVSCRRIRSGAAGLAR